MTTEVSYHDVSETHDAHDHGDHKPTGFLDRWLFTTNHKDIGTLYLIFSLTMFMIGGAMAMMPSVSVTSGASALTRMPCGASSSAAVLV